MRNRVISCKRRKGRKKFPRENQKVGAYHNTPGGGGLAVRHVETDGEVICRISSELRLLKRAQFSLFDLLVYRKDEFGAKPGWLYAIAVGKEPDSGRYNLSWHRLHVHAPDYASGRIRREDFVSAAELGKLGG